jgi:hypothetical protein
VEVDDEAASVKHQAHGHSSPQGKALGHSEFLIVAPLPSADSLPTEDVADPEATPAKGKPSFDTKHYSGERSASALLGDESLPPGQAMHDLGEGGAGALREASLPPEQVVLLVLTVPAARVIHQPAGAIPLQEDPVPAVESIPLGPVAPVVRKLTPPHPGDPVPAGEEEATRLLVVLPSAARGMRQAALAFEADEVSAALADMGHGPTGNAGAAQGGESPAGVAPLGVVPLPAIVPLSPSALGTGGGSGKAGLRPNRPDLLSPAAQDPRGDEISAPFSPERYALPAERSPAPQGAGLLTAGIALDAAALERAVQALVAPVLEAGASGSLYWLGASSWLLATALAFETARRRRAQRPSPCPVFPADFLPEGRS